LGVLAPTPGAHLCEERPSWRRPGDVLLGDRPG
jgi:hypothetical protein